MEFNENQRQFLMAFIADGIEKVVNELPMDDLVDVVDAYRQLRDYKEPVKETKKPRQA